jgi:Fe-S-cluster containining protein
MQSFTLRKLKQRLKKRRKSFLGLLNSIDKKPPRNIQSIALKANSTVWDEVDCLSCANCCKVMTPTYTNSDLKRIAGHLEMPVDEMKSKWLKKERGTGDWINKTTPCQFLDLKTNLCGIYEVRPADCAGFPHLNKRKMIDYIHVHKQNLDECPATFKMVEKMETLLSERA